MSAVLEVSGLCKEYPKFQLKDVSFTLDRGSIMGLIGRNGAGKTTTIKALLNLIRTSGGKIRYFGMDLYECERAIKQRIGYADGAAQYYPKKKIRDIAAVTKRFYDSWDDAAYRRYLDLFSLDEDKTPSELSQGMKVKLNLALALPHGAELLILDEPTSGLDPVSRSELLDVFRYLAERGTSILFSTHITSDLEKCADAITYIRDGRVEASGTMEKFIQSYAEQGHGETLEDIMVHLEQEAFREKLAR